MKSPGAATLLFLLPTAIASAAGNDAARIDYFEQHVRPLLVRHCYECHSIESGNRNGGLFLDSRAGWEIGGETGPAIVPGVPEGSLVIRAVRYEDPGLKMPPGGQLPKDAIARLEHWVQMGASDPRNNEPAVTDRTGPDPSDPIAGRSHWAFRPLAQPAVPQVDDEQWPLNSIDRFVLAKLESEDLAPATDADRRH